MGYRDDRDAAFERAEALAVEVRQRTETIAEKERQIELLRAEVEAAKARPLTDAELEAKDEGRNEGRRQAFRAVTLVVGILCLVSSGLTASAGTAAYLVNRAPPTQYAAMARAMGDGHEAIAAAADWGTFVASTAMTLALILISIGMIGRARWSAWAGAIWAFVAIVLSLAAGAVGAHILGPTAWITGILGAVPPLLLGLYSAVRIRYELR